LRGKRIKGRKAGKGWFIRIFGRGGEKKFSPPRHMLLGVASQTGVE